MSWVDWIIVIVLAASALGGLAQGFFRTACSLVGLVMGLSLAAWNYARVAAIFLPWVRIPAVADALAFFLIALVVMAMANLIGSVLGSAFDRLGLGCLDTIGGGVLGFFQGAVLVTLCLLVAVAFFSHAGWLVNSRLSRLFFGVLHASVHMSPQELGERLRRGLTLLEQQAPPWMHPGMHPGPGVPK